MPSKPRRADSCSLFRPGRRGRKHPKRATLPDPSGGVRISVLERGQIVPGRGMHDHLRIAMKGELRPKHARIREIALKRIKARRRLQSVLANGSTGPERKKIQKRLG